MRILTLALIFSTSGCFGQSSSQLGTATFSYANGGGDLATHPVAAGGARTTIDVSIPFSSIRSTAPAVATFVANGSQVDLVSGVPGTAQLEVLDIRGGVLGSATVFVVATASLQVSQGWSGARPTVVAGTPQVLHVATIGADGNTTRGDGAVTFALAGGLSAAEVPVDGDGIGFVGSVGTGTISASCPDATVTQEIDVVPQADVTRLATSSVVDAAGNAIVGMVATTDAGGVYAEPCVWTASDPSVTLSSQLSGLAEAPGVLGFFNLTRPGTFTVSCAMAGQTASVSLTRAM
jgi:hypothetical protein